MIIPYRVDVPFDHQPVTNWAVFGLLILVFSFQVLENRRIEGQIRREVYRRVADGETHEQALEHARESIVEDTMFRFALRGWRLKGLFGHMWLHGGLIHLAGNLIFLWVFGNAVCSKLGNISYLPIYIGLGVISAIIHLLFTGSSAIGASGAINGIVGMFLILFPENELSCIFILWIPLMFRPYFKTFAVRSFWIILMWFAFDIWGAFSGAGHIAYFAHIGGFIGGIVLVILLLKAKLIVMEKDEKSLLLLLGLEKKQGIEELVQTAQEVKTYPAPLHQPWETKVKEKAKPQTIPLVPLEPEDNFIRFSCQCGKKIKTARKNAGKTGRCPKCKQKVKVPKQ